MGRTAKAAIFAIAIHPPAIAARSGRSRRRLSLKRTLRHSRRSWSSRASSPAPAPRASARPAARRGLARKSAYTQQMICKVCKTERVETDFQLLPGNLRRKTCRFCAAEERRLRRLKNLPREKATARAYREAHREQTAARKAVYQSGIGRHRMLEAGKRYRQTEHGKEIKRAGSARWRKTEKGRVAGRIRCSRRRARRLSANGQILPIQWLGIIKMQKNRCFYCRKRFTKKQPPTMDHIIALSQGGDHMPENIVAACRSCNSSKGSKRTQLI